MPDERKRPEVDLSLPVVQDLIERYGQDYVSYTPKDTDEEVVSTVEQAFRDCGDLSQMGRVSGFALEAVIEDKVSTFKAKHSES